MMKKSFLVGFLFTVLVCVGTVRTVEGMKDDVVRKNNARDDTCGANVKWSLNEGVLTLTGSGVMYDYERAAVVPWSKDASSILKVVVESGVTSIGNHSFEKCTQISNIIFSDTLISIGDYAFSQCHSLVSIVIPDGVVSIGRNVFYWCHELTTVKVPASVTSIGNQAFDGCRSLKSVEVNENNKNYTSLDGVLFNHDCTTLLQYTTASENKAYVIPNSVKVIGSLSFYNSSHLNQVIIPDSVLSIEMFAFALCSLTSVVIPDSVRSADMNAFLECKNLESVFYEGSNDISTSNIFSSCDLKTICVPPDYNSTVFCKNGLKLDSSACQQFRRMFDHCFKAAWNEDDFVQIKRNNATEWERKTNQCIQYGCDNETGSFVRNLCNNSGKICLNDRCVEKDTEVNDMFSVELEFDGIPLDEINATAILDTLSEECNINIGDISLGWESDEEGLIVRIIVYVKDEQTANTVADTVEEIAKGEGCKHGVLCRTKSVRVITKPEEAEFLSINSIARISFKEMITVVMVSFIILLRLTP